MHEICRRDWLVRALVALGFAGLSPVLHAHAQLVRSKPKDKSEVAEPPKTIELWFNELLDQGFHTVELFAAADRSKKNRKSLIKREPQVDTRDRTHLVTEIEKL